MKPSPAYRKRISDLCRRIDPPGTGKIYVLYHYDENAPDMVEYNGEKMTMKEFETRYPHGKNSITIWVDYVHTDPVQDV